MDDLATRVETRLREEWPGTYIPKRLSFAPPIREDGATDTFVKLAARIIREEVAK